MSRPGVLEAADDGVDFSGESATLEVATPVTYRDGGAKDAEKMGDTLLNSSDVVCKTDNQCDYFTNPGKGPGVKFTDFAGVQAMGTWTFCAGDSVGTDTGSIGLVTLTLFLQ